MHGEVPSLNDFRAFSCRGYVLILVHGKAHKSRLGGARFYHPPTNNFGTSGHVDWHPESLYYPNLTKYDVAAKIQGVGQVEDYQFLVGTTHFDDDYNLLYVTKEVYLGKSPVGPVILVKRAPIMRGGLVAKRIDDTPVYVEDVVRMTGAVIPEDTEVSDWEDSKSVKSVNVESSKNNDTSENSLRTTGGDMTTPGKRLPRHSYRKAGKHSGSKKDDSPITVGGRTSEATRVDKNKPMSIS